jgi:hypothetical protein
MRWKGFLVKKRGGKRPELIPQEFAGSPFFLGSFAFFNPEGSFASIPQTSQMKSLVEEMNPSRF